MAPCPTGHYTVPLNQTQEVNTCVVDSSLGGSWACLDIAQLGITIWEPQGGQPEVHFDDYSLITSQFRYGPQPPDFNGSDFTLQPYKDTDNPDLGVALFFSALFDKLVICEFDRFAQFRIPTNC